MRDIFNHEEMSKLAEENPEEFNEISRSAIEEFIKNSPASRKSKLRKLQAVIDRGIIEFEEDQWKEIVKKFQNSSSEEIIKDIIEYIETISAEQRENRRLYQADLFAKILLLNPSQMQNLAEKNPSQFEKLADLLIVGFIQFASPQKRKRLEGLQWRIDMIRQQSRNHYQALIGIFDLLINKVYSDKGLLYYLDELIDKNENELQPACDILLKAERRKTFALIKNEGGE